MASATTSSPQEVLSFEEIYDIVKRKEQAHYDLVYRTLLSKSDYLSTIPKNESYSILHFLVLHGELDLFNKVIAIPNIRFILLTKSAQKPYKDVLQISEENKSKSSNHKKLYEEIDHLVQLDRFVEYAKLNQTNECIKMIEQDPNLVNEKPPYRKYYLIHHLAYANNRNAFDQFRQKCEFNFTLLTSDKKTASEVAYEQGHKQFAGYLETLAPEMRKIREERQKDKVKRQQKQIEIQNKADEQVEQKIVQIGGNNMLDCFTCPLTRELFRDPVILSDGFTYEREAIQHWLDAGNRRSPMTNIELTNLDLVPNMIIKQALNELADKQKK